MMIARPDDKTQVLVTTSVERKLEGLVECVHGLLLGQTIEVPLRDPGRDVQVLPIRELPPKKGLSLREGQARLLHDLASIELQAMELAVRTLSEFPEAPREFREELAQVALDEGRHLRLCLDGLRALDLPWGSFPVHLGLWQSVSHEDSLLDRVVIVHRYLEGSGLDASDQLLRRLTGVRAPETWDAVSVIRHDEVKHVLFGSRWYRRLCALEKLDPDDDFRQRLLRLVHRIPRRLEPVAAQLRASVGFSAAEVDTLIALRERWLSGGPQVHSQGLQAKS